MFRLNTKLLMLLFLLTTSTFFYQNIDFNNKNMGILKFLKDILKTEKSTFPESNQKSNKELKDNIFQKMYAIKSDYRKQKTTHVDETHEARNKGLVEQQKAWEKLREKQEKELKELIERQIKAESAFVRRIKGLGNRDFGEEWQKNNAVQQATNEFRQLFERHLQEDEQLLQRHQQETRQLLEQQRQDWERSIQDFGQQYRRFFEAERRETERAIR